VASAYAAMRPPSRMRPIDRAVAGLLLILMAAGSLWLWIGIPALTLWGVAQIVDTSGQHLVLGLLAVPAAMVLFAGLLFWLNGLYLRVVAPRLMPEDEDGELRQIRGPLELLLGWSLAAAVVVALIWLFLHPIPQLSGGIG
jgi:Na+/H+ antiporter NhaD/arsenite permease-like protein